MEDKTILVTGGAGYLGCVLVPTMLQKDYKVKVIDTMWYGQHNLDLVKNSENLEIIKGDIRDNKLVGKLTSKSDMVIHLACISNDPSFDLNPELGKQVNYDATKNLVKISKENNIERFIYASTGAVYGVKDDPEVTEDLPLTPLTDYAKYKALGEKALLDEINENFVGTIIRSATICGYSPRQRLDLVVNILAAHGINNRVITVFGGEQKRPNIHISDSTNCYINLLEADANKINGEVFNIGTENHKVSDLAIMIKDIIGEDVEIVKKDVVDQRSYHLNSDKIRKTLGFSNKKTVKDAVIDLKNAFNDGRIPNWKDIDYYNVKKIKSLGLA
jgi:nucleoside-diphosphate-sugar epimerase